MNTVTDKCLIYLDVVYFSRNDIRVRYSCTCSAWHTEMKLQYFGHVVRVDNLCASILLNLSYKGYINGIRRKETYGLMTIKDWTVPRHRLSTLGRQAFSVAGPTTWNSLPGSLHDPALRSDSFRCCQEHNCLPCR